MWVPRAGRASRGEGAGADIMAVGWREKGIRCGSVWLGGVG